MRNRTSAWKPSSYKSIFNDDSISLRTSSFTFKDLLGYTYKTDYYPLEDTRNLGGTVVDANKLSKDYPNWAKSWPNNTSDADYFSFTNFDYYSTNSTITKKTTKGFKLSLGPLSIGKKKTYSSVFSESFVSTKNATFGEMYGIVRKDIYNINLSSNIFNKIKSYYLAKEFKEELYNTHPTEFISNYGYLVLTNFITGGKVSALYTGIYKKQESSETKTQNMDKEIDASYTFKTQTDEVGKASHEIKYGRGNNSTVSVTNEFSSIRMSIKTLGGSSAFASFSVPKEIKDINLNLSSWAESLNNQSNLSIIEFGDNSLYPIIDFIPEQNLIDYIIQLSHDEAFNQTNKIQKLKEPVFVISLDNGGGRWSLSTVLFTRFGDQIVFDVQYIPFPSAIVNQYINSQTTKISKMFNNIKIVNSKETVSSNYTPIFSQFRDYEESNLSKFTYDGVIYIVNTQKQALSIHKDSFIEEYGMRNLVNRLPLINLNYEIFIRDYTIFAL